MLAALVVITVISALVSAGFSLAAVFFPRLAVREGEASATARVFAYYGVARAVPLLLVVLWAAFRADPIALLWLGTLTGLIQLADAAVGTATGDPLKIWGPLALATVQLATVLLAFWFV